METKSWFSPPFVTHGNCIKMYLENSCPPNLTLKTRQNSIEAKSQKGGSSMTITIAALCEDKKEVILVSDRMISTFSPSLMFEHETKGEKLSHNALVLSAGQSSELEFIKESKAEIDNDMSIKKVAEILAQKYGEFRIKRTEENIFKPLKFQSFDDFYEKQRLINDAWSKEIYANVIKPAFFVELILGGIDETGHVYYIAEPGKEHARDVLGFQCAGVGKERASLILELCGYSPSASFSRVLNITFFAKKMTEILGGIGKETDIWTINKESGVIKLPPETIQKLEKNYEEQEKPTRFFKEIEIKEEDIKDKS